MKSVILCILDGVGLRTEKKGNALLLAKTPNFDHLWNTYPHCCLEASGEEVGLPAGQMGNSEVGHMNIGAGRIVYQDILRINRSIEDGTFYKNTALLSAIENCNKYGTNLHIYGLLSDGGIHSQMSHLFAILDICKKENFKRVYIHVILDGRDTGPMVAPTYVDKLKRKLEEIGFGKIVTIQGRYYVMNRDRNWPLTKMAYDAMVNGKSDHNAPTTEEAFSIEYEEKNTDEFMKPTVLESIPIMDNDSIITFNYRSDRMIQMMRALNDPTFTDFERSRGYIKVHFVTLTQYEEQNYNPNILIAFEEQVLTNTLGSFLSKKGKTQLRISEYEKSQHVTFFFSGLTDQIYEGEDRIILDRPDVFTYDEMPEMRSSDITEKVIESAEKGYDFIVINYPNGDAVGHSGNLEASIKAVEALDVCLGRLIKEIDLTKYTIAVTADHGNCEYMIDENGEVDKKHTTNPVPFILVGENCELTNGKLGDIAPTLLTLLNIEVPKEMTGRVLLMDDISLKM